MDNNNTSMESSFNMPPKSYWLASTEKPNYPSLEEDIKVDVAIVGGGMAGITTAYLLMEQGVKVAIIEADKILQGTTAHTTAKLTSQHDLIYYKIKSKMGEEKAKQYAEANEHAISLVENIISSTKIDCDFHKSSAYVYTHQDDYIQKIQDEVETAASLGIKASYLEEIPLGFKIKAAMRFDNQARFHPLKYLLPLAKEISEKNCQIFEQTRAVKIDEGDPCSVITDRGNRVIASNIVLASHYPFHDWPGLYFSRLYPERSYVIAVKTEEKFPEGMFITAEDPGRSLRLQDYEGGELLLVGGEHHKTGQGENTIVHYENLKKFAEENFKVKEIPFRWSTQDYSTPDEVPYIGRLTSNTPNIFVATGFRKWGMTNTTVSAIIIRDLITKGGSPWEEVYSPSRFTPTASAKNFIVENANVARELITGKLEVAPGEIDVNPGEGKVITINNKKAGVYKDDEGKLHIIDTTCKHLGCETHWNAAEKSWDCPCHGSRYTPDGDIIEGPTVKCLDKVDLVQMEF